MEYPWIIYKNGLAQSKFSKVAKDRTIKFLEGFSGLFTLETLKFHDSFQQKRMLTVQKIQIKQLATPTVFFLNYSSNFVWHFLFSIIYRMIKYPPPLCCELLLAEICIFLYVLFLRNNVSPLFS